MAETDTTIYMLEPKAQNEMMDADVLAKRDAAVEWCKNATEHTASYNGKPWRYALIPHDVISENVTLEWLMQQFQVR